jgi:5-methylcytosine-specific restriction endonuclease McrA
MGERGTLYKGILGKMGIRRIVITEEDRKKYEARALELQRNHLLKKKQNVSKKFFGKLKRKKRQDKIDASRKSRQKNRKKNLIEDFYLTPKWRELRYKILRKYGFKCLACGAKPPDTVLHVDHIKPRIKFPDLEFDPNNLQVLCESCNLGKRHYFSDDLRP